MSDGSRAEITNGIWLCRNCHKLIDNDPIAYAPELLFLWRNEHEQHVMERVGSRTEVIRWELAERSLEGLFGGNSLAKQIARDKAAFWEFRLIAELLRSRLRSASRAWFELRSNLKSRQLRPLEDEQVLKWFQMKLDEGVGFIGPLTTLYTVELERSWGPPGMPGDVEAIDHVCKLIGDVADEMIRWEGDVRSVWTSETYQGLVGLLPGVMGRNLERLLEVPGIVDAGIDRAEASPASPTVIDHTLVFDMPEGWNDAVEAEFKKIQRALL